MITKTEAFNLMKDEIKCQDCDGTGEYFQKNPDCLHCSEIDHCNAIDYKCVVPSDCPSCSGKGVIIEDVIMMIIYELASVWDWKNLKNNPMSDSHKQDYINKHLTKALLLLLALNEVLEIPTQIIYGHVENNPSILSIITDISTGVKAYITRATLLLTTYCTSNSIDIKSHIKAYQESRE